MMEIKLTQGKTATIDDEDFEVVSSHKWSAVQVYRNRWFATRQATIGKRKYYTEYLHRAIGKPQPGTAIVAIDGDYLNCQKSNLLETSNANRLRRKKRQYMRDLFCKDEISIPEYAKLKHFHRNTISRMCRMGKLNARKVGRAWAIRVCENECPEKI